MSADLVACRLHVILSFVLPPAGHIRMSPAEFTATGKQPYGPRQYPCVGTRDAMGIESGQVEVLPEKRTIESLNRALRKPATDFSSRPDGDFDATFDVVFGLYRFEDCFDRIFEIMCQ